MASVWAGTNESTGKLVALKVIRAGFMATPGADAFLRSEGLVASRINHPNVVTVFDVVEQDGMVCIVMELLDGVTLGTYISRYGPLGLRDAVSLLLPAMRGVAAAHAQGVVHRDLKPHNVFVCIGPDARIVTTKVLDFGISLMVDWARGSSVAAIPGLVGTPSYMAPEHIEGSTVLDPRTDVYGFGLLLYEALSGRMAFAGDSESEQLRQVLNESPVPLRELRPDLPIGLIAVIETAMAKRPEQRFAGLNEMVLALEEQLALAAPLSAGTPASGVPTAGMSYSVSSSLAIAVPSHIGREPSEPIVKTQIFGQPLGRNEEPGTPRSNPADDSARRPLVAGSANAVTPAQAGSDAGPATKMVSPKARWVLARLHNRRVLAGAGIVALSLILVAILAARPSPSLSSGAPPPGSSMASPSSTPVAEPATPSPVVTPLPEPVEDPPVPATEASASIPASPSINELPGRAPRAGAPKPGTPMPRAAKRSTLRAGSLREADF